MAAMSAPAAPVASAPAAPVAAASPISPRSSRARWCRRYWSGSCVPAKCRWTNWSARSARPRSRSRRRRRAGRRSAGRRARAAASRRRKSQEAGRRRKPVVEVEVLRRRQVANQSIRVNVDTLEHLMTMVSELVLTRNQLLEISRRNEDTEFKVPLQRLSNVTAELQEGVMKTRMQPIGNAWQKLPRIVRDLSGELHKQIELEMHGADTELDRQVLDLIKDPLTHMVRNSADHGLETPAERARRRQARAGHHPAVRLSRRRPHHHLHRRQRPRPQHRADQGQGGLQRSRQRGRTGEDDRSPDPQVHLRAGLLDRRRRHLACPAAASAWTWCAPISTRSAAPSTSSRWPARAPRVTIKIPLTLAIVSALIVEAAGDRFAIPQLAVVELVRARANSEHRIERIKDTAVLRLRNKLLPLMHLKKLLKIDDGSSSDPENGFIVVTQVGSQTFGIVVDGVFHTEEIVVKPMSTKLRHIDMFSGNTILGDGAVIMIIDPNGIAKALGASGAAAHEIADENAACARQRRRAADLAAGVPRRLRPAQGGAARARHPAGRDRRRQDRTLQRPLHGAVPRPADAAGADGRRQRPDLGRAADPGVRRRRPLDGPGGRRDHRHRRGTAQHRGRRLPGRHSGLGRDQGPGHRSDRRRPLPADGVRRLVHPQGDASLGDVRNRCCWSTTARSSATCWRRC